MGQKQSFIEQATHRDKYQRLSINHFEFMYIVGRGGFGKVWKVRTKKDKKLYAMKEMAKVKIIDKKSEKSIKYEKELLTRLKHNFIVNMHYAFQDYNNLYIVLDMLPGGDLRYHISKYKKFTEEQTKFFIACVVHAIEYIHSHNVLHRDIKPENLVLDENGYLRITDFGIAKVFQRENSSETSGTPGYMSPEVMCAQNHSYVVDYFAIGVMGYEFMYGRRPYVGKSRKEIKEQIMAKQALVKELPDGWPPEAGDFINKCLQRKPGRRMGINGSSEAKEHPWFKNFPWNDLSEKKLDSPFKPKIGDNFDKRYCEGIEKIGLETKERYENYIRDENFNYIFRNFTYGDVIENPSPSPSVLKPTMKNIVKQSVKPVFSSNTSLNSLIKKPNSYSKSSLNGIYNSMINNLKHSNTNRSIKYSIDKTESTKTGRSSSIKVSNNNEKLDSLRIKKLVSSSSSNNIFKNVKSSAGTSNALIYYKKKGSKI